MEIDEDEIEKGRKEELVEAEEVKFWVHEFESNSGYFIPIPGAEERNRRIMKPEIDK